VSWAPYLIPLVSAIVAFAAFYFATQASRSTAASGVHAVDAEAYTRASAIYEDTITNLRADIAALRVELTAARAEIRELRQSNNRMLVELRRLGKQIDDDTGPQTTVL
jgi:chromosome segregation ATPase